MRELRKYLRHLDSCPQAQAPVGDGPALAVALGPCDCGLEELLKEADAFLDPAREWANGYAKGKADAGASRAAQPEDYEWALERVTNMCASALADAHVYGKKLLKGFGYPNETFSRAQDHRALRIVLEALNAQSAAPSLPDQPASQPSPSRDAGAERGEQAHRATQGSAEWWVCFTCWKAYYVPTTGYYGKCQDCGKETRPWPADPRETLSLIEWRRPAPSPTTQPSPSLREACRATWPDNPERWCGPCLHWGSGYCTALARQELSPSERAKSIAWKGEPWDSERECGCSYVRGEQIHVCPEHHVRPGGEGKGCDHKFVDSTRCLKCGWEAREAAAASPEPEVRLPQLLARVFELTGAEAIEIHSGDREPGNYITRAAALRAARGGDQ